jgi:hypothetical protein
VELVPFPNPCSATSLETFVTAAIPWGGLAGAIQ